MHKGTLNRRSLLVGIGIAGAALALAGCATTTAGTVTTITLNVAKISAYAEAGLNAASMVTDALALFPGLSAYASQLQPIETALKTALTDFSAVAGSSVTVAYDQADVKSAVNSILSAIQQVSALIVAIVAAMAQQAVLGIKDATVSRIQLTSDAIATIVATLKALLSTNVSLNFGAAPRLAMSEARALQVLAA